MPSLYGISKNSQKSLKKGFGMAIEAELLALLEASKLGARNLTGKTNFLAGNLLHSRGREWVLRVLSLNRLQTFFFYYK